MANLLAAAAFFVLLHLLVSGTPVRDVIVGRIGQNAYAGLFSLASVAGLVWLGLGFAQGRTEPWNESYWTLTPGQPGADVTLVYLLAHKDKAAATAIAGGLLTLETAFEELGIARMQTSDYALREGALVGIEGHVNLNTASREALRALAAGALQQDPVAGRHRIVPPGRDDPERTHDLGPHRLVETFQPGRLEDRRLGLWRRGLRTGPRGRRRGGGKAPKSRQADGAAAHARPIISVAHLQKSPQAPSLERLRDACVPVAGVRLIEVAEISARRQGR